MAFIEKSAHQITCNFVALEGKFCSACGAESNIVATVFAALVRGSVLKSKNGEVLGAEELLHFSIRQQYKQYIGFINT